MSASDTFSRYSTQKAPKTEPFVIQTNPHFLTLGITLQKARIRPIRQKTHRLSSERKGNQLFQSRTRRTITPPLRQNHNFILRNPHRLLVVGQGQGV